MLERSVILFILFFQSDKAYPLFQIYIHMKTFSTIYTTQNEFFINLVHSQLEQSHQWSIWIRLLSIWIHPRLNVWFMFLNGKASVLSLRDVVWSYWYSYHISIFWYHNCEWNNPLLKRILSCLCVQFFCVMLLCLTWLILLKS